MQKMSAFIAKNQRFLPMSVTAILSIAAYLVGALLYPGMRDAQVFFNLFRTSPFLLISVIGMTFVILTGGIDLSVSGVVALTTVAAAALLREGWNAWLVMLLMLLMGMAFGATMGAFITYLKVQPFIATLAGMWVARGLCFFISDDAIAINNPVYCLLGQTMLLIPGFSDPKTQQGAFISPLVIIAFVVLAVATYVAHYTRFGRTIYAIGGNEGRNEQSARLMGLPVDRTKVLVYTLNGFCSALAGIILSIYVSSGHGLYARGFEMTVIAAVVMGGTMLTGGQGYVFGALFGVLITGVTQTLIQFNGQLSSWWTNIVVGLLTLFFIGAQSFLATRKGRQVEAGSPEVQRRRRMLVWGGSAVGVIVVGALILGALLNPKENGAVGTTPTAESAVCQFQPTSDEDADALIAEGAVLTYERNGGPDCIDELFAIYPDGRIIGVDGARNVEKQATVADVETLLAGIRDQGWFTDEFYNTWHTPCGQCFEYHITVIYEGEEKRVTAVDGGTDAPAAYWQVVSRINGVIPKFPETP